jgi:hypothetical protein
MFGFFDKMATNLKGVDKIPSPNGIEKTVEDARAFYAKMLGIQKGNDASTGSIFNLDPNGATNNLSNKLIISKMFGVKNFKDIEEYLKQVKGGK